MRISPARVDRTKVVAIIIFFHVYVYRNFFFTVHHHYTITSVLLLQLLNSLSSELDVMLSELCSGSPASLISGELDDECYSEDYRYFKLGLFQLIIYNLIPA